MALTESRPGVRVKVIKRWREAGIKATFALRVSEIGTLRGNFWKRPQIVLFHGVAMEYFKFYPYMEGKLSSTGIKQM